MNEKVITNTEQANAFAKENLVKSPGLIPVVVADGKKIEGTDIQCWQVLWANENKPDSSPEVLIGASQFIADNGQVIQISSAAALSPNYSFKEEFLKQYRG